MASSFLLAVFCIAAYVAVTEGHGRMLEPPSRGTAWRLGFATPINTYDHGTDCGGFQEMHEVSNGKCGACGDKYSGPLLHEPGPDNRFASGVIVRTYEQGQQIIVDPDARGSHRGFHEFRLCRNDVPQLGQNRSVSVIQECFDEHLLLSPAGESRFNHLARNITLKLPGDVVCTACVLQWRWRAGDRYGCEDDTCGIGIGDQDEFRTCSDVAIKPHNNTDLQMPQETTLSTSELERETLPSLFTETTTSETSPTDSISQSTSSSVSEMDLPLARRLECSAVEPWGSHVQWWCNANCNHDPPFCPQTHCSCQPSEQVDQGQDHPKD